MNQLSPPSVTIHQGHQPRLPPADARVVIDVIRAFTTTQIALKGGARRILLAGTLEEARNLSEANPSRLLAGERNALAPDDFDLGNSPAEFAEADLTDKELVLTTSNGVQATLHAWHGGPVVVTGFSNAGTTLRFLQKLDNDGARRIQLLASHPDGDEDLACAEWLKARILHEAQPDDDALRSRILNCRAAQKFLDPDQPRYRADDIDYCARRDDSPWVMVVRKSGDHLLVDRLLVDESRVS